MDKTFCPPCTPEDATQSHGTLDTTSSHSQPHTEEGVEHTDKAPKAHKRKRFTKAETREHLELITKAVKENKSLAALRRDLSLSETKLCSYIADLAVNGLISFDNYKESLFPVGDIQNAVVQLLGITDMKNTLLTIEASETGLLISIVPSDHNI